MASTDTTLPPHGTNWAPYRPAQGKSIYVSGAWAIETLKPDAIGFTIQIRRAGVDVTGDAVVTHEDGVLAIASGESTYTLEEGDIAYWTAF